MAHGAALITVDVVYAEAERAIVKSYCLDQAATLQDALCLAAADPDFATIDVASSPAGIYGKAAPAAQRLEDGDRIELYRPLAADPKTARRARVEQARRQCQ